ncbi:MAG: MFS transporter, partial [Chromatiales bacterium]|nr:MFS transporter [Chromatiales bacterium]
MHTNQSDLRVRMMALAIAGFVSGASVRVAEPLLPTLAEHFDVPVAEAAQIIGGFALAYGLFQLVHGPLGDRLGKLPMVGLMAVLASAMCFASAYADTLNGLIALRVATGATAGAIIPLSFSFVGDNVQFADRQRVLARFISGILMGQILGPALGGIVSEWLGWQAVFTLLGAGFLTVGVALLSLAVGGAPEPRASVGVSVLATYRALLSSPTVRVVCAVVAVEGFFFHGALGFVGA